MAIENTAPTIGNHNGTPEGRLKANIQAQEIIDSAKSSIKYELAKAKDELKNDIIDMTIKATEDLIKEKMTGDEDRKLVKDFIEGINTEPPVNNGHIG